VVTGGSSGIGRAIAIALARAGVGRVLVHFRQNQAGASQTVAALNELNCQASAFAADLSNPEDVRRLCDHAFTELGTIQTWVNNAGADVLTGAAGELDFDAKLQRLWQVDVAGTIRLSRQVGQRLMNQPSPFPPSLVFIGWDQATRGMEGEAGQMFGPVKSAVMAYASSLAQSLAPHVRVNTVAPGWIRTAWGESTSAYWDKRAKEQSLMNRWGQPEDVARAVVFAADPANTFLTGQSIDINGGWNRRFQ
jgi:3-oxoacyl-[acyl-carrier protein] reductase